MSVISRNLAMDGNILKLMELPLDSFSKETKLPKISVLMSNIPKNKLEMNQLLKVARFYLIQGYEEDFLSLVHFARSFSYTNYPEFKADLVSSYNIIAQYYLNKANHSHLKEKKLEFITAVKNIYSTISEPNFVDKNQLIITGYLQLLEDWVHRENAKKSFDTVYDGDPSNFLALLGLGYYHYYKNDLILALSFYRKALIACPDHANDARYMIGVCNYKMGKIHHAEIAFQRTVNLDPDHAGALIALALIKFNNKQEGGDIKDAMKWVSRVYGQNCYNVASLNILSNHFFS